MCLKRFLCRDVHKLSYFHAKNVTYLLLLSAKVNTRSYGSHWKAQKKFKKSDKKSDGHLGGSLGYDYNTYKPYTKDGPNGMKNSQSREQMHSVLDKLGKSLRQKNYHNLFL